MPFDMALRAQPCTVCHGLQGQSTPYGYFPRLAGKPVLYLYEQLLHFREGRRQYPAMQTLLQVLGDEMLWALAEHFAGEAAAYLPSASIQQTPRQQRRGRALALEGDATLGVPACVSCHGQALTGVSPWVPGVLGLSRDYLNAQLGAWRQGQRAARAPDCMAEVARRLAPDDITAVAGWLATQPVVNGGQAHNLTEHVKNWPQAPMACGIWLHGVRNVLLR